MDQFMQEMRQLIAQHANNPNRTPQDQNLIDYYSYIFDSIDNDPDIAHYFSSDNPANQGSIQNHPDNQFVMPEQQLQQPAVAPMNQPQPESPKQENDFAASNPQGKVNPASVGKMLQTQNGTPYGTGLGTDVLSQGSMGTNNFSYLPKSKSFTALKGL